MDNPAEALLNLLSGWTGPANQHAASYRQAGSAHTHDFFLVQNRALMLLFEVEREIDEILVTDPDFDVEVLRNDLIPVYRAVYGLDPLWSGGGGGTVLKDPAPLRRVSSMLRMRRRGWEMAQGDKESLIEMLGEALEVANDAAYLRPEVRAFVVETLARAMRYVRDPDRTDGEVRSAVHEASGAALAAAQAPNVPPEKRNLFVRVAASLAVGVGSNIAAEGATSGLQALYEAARPLIEGAS